MKDTRYYESFSLEGIGGRVIYDLVDDPKGAIIICPGGGYSFLSTRESYPILKAFRDENYQAFILEYTIGKSLGNKPLKQLAQAIKEISINESLFKLKNKPVIICGFSAGGHLAASYGVHWMDEVITEIKDPRRPDGLILCYPVITTGEYAHTGSIEALGLDKSETDYYSLEKHINKDTPQTFIWHTSDDATVRVENTLLFIEGLAKRGIPFESHIYPFGTHGLSLATKEVEEPEKNRYSDGHISGWFNLCLEWLDIIIMNYKKENV